MANRQLFPSFRGNNPPPADTINEAGGVAYALHPKHALAQYAATGCLNHTYYASGEAQLQRVVNLAYEVDAEFVARTAVFCRTRSFMKDMPALLCAVLSLKDGNALERVFHRVMDDGKMLRNFVQVLRSGAVGRKSLGSRPKRLVRQWLERRSDEQVFRAAVGQSPSLQDVIKMVHPKPKDPAREALYGYLIGKPKAGAPLSPLVQAFEEFKRNPGSELPDVPFQLLTSAPLEDRHWMEIARQASWQMTRMNLNTFARHGVFKDRKMTTLIADRLSNPDAIKRARVFPYQLMVAYQNTGDGVPAVVVDALQEAMEIAIENVPRVEGKIYVLPDVSGSMLSPATGHRQGATSKVRCIDVAALMAAAMLRKNPDAEVIPFAESARHVRLNPRDSVMTNAARLAKLGGGGTNCSAPLRELNSRKAHGELVMFVSDNESWMDNRGWGQATATMTEWEGFKKRNPGAKLVCLDIQPYGHTQAAERHDVMNVGGFSDQVFEAVAAFAQSADTCHWVDMIEQVNI
ncbi:MAG: RNA-binding protein [Myxococcota bacterium]